MLSGNRWRPSPEPHFYFKLIVDFLLFYSGVWSLRTAAGVLAFIWFVDDHIWLSVCILHSLWALLLIFFASRQWLYFIFWTLKDFEAFGCSDFLISWSCDVRSRAYNVVRCPRCGLWLCRLCSWALLSFLTALLLITEEE